MGSTPDTFKGVPIKICIKFNLFIVNFQTQVADACNKAFTNTGPIICQSIASANPTIEWLTTIARTPKFLKKDKFQLLSQAHYISWLDTAVDGRKSKVGLLLTMANPAEALKQVAKEDLVAAHVAHKDKNDNEDLDAVDWERINTHMNKIYAKKLTNVKYNWHLTVYIAADPHQYILLTLEAVQEWAHALTVCHPPPPLAPSIKFHSRALKRCGLRQNPLTPPALQVSKNWAHQ
ncbi:hypothetical protein VP01_1805g2 [Puccinia sorghi]|uniref:Uncharacterized protein n=1 Tax=Puccinia sorghi TaxID=27349 RepID=A0A0L6VE53_9BASI|nr:hypothetical protein VP01_1805g2 [Puccinia sorghi]